MKCQTLFPWKHIKNISRCRLPKIKVSMAKVNKDEFVSFSAPYLHIDMNPDSKDS